jgi:hypothetical protein
MKSLLAFESIGEENVFLPGVSSAFLYAVFNKSFLSDMLKLEAASSTTISLRANDPTTPSCRSAPRRAAATVSLY